MQNTIYGNRVSLGERLGDIVARTRSFPHEICKEAPRIRVGNMRSLAAGLIAIFLFSSPCVALMHTRHATKSFASTPLISRISATPIPYSIPSAPHCLSSSTPTCLQLSSNNKDPQTSTSNDNSETKEPTAFERVAQQGLAGVLAIAVAEAIFWALGVPLASLWSLYTTGQWLDLGTQEGQIQAASFSFGYGGFATVILQYRVTLFAIPLVPIMDKLVVQPGKKFFGEKWGEKTNT